MIVGFVGPASAQGQADDDPGSPPSVEPGPEQDAHHPHGHDSHDVEKVVVTGNPIAHDRDELAIPVDRLDRDEILDDLGATLGETLVRQPGVATTGFTAGASRPVIRGQDAYRTEVTEDGLPTQDVSRESPDHAVPVNPLAVERIEVVRGPATLRYGGGATAGVVNAITHRIPDKKPGVAIAGEVFGALDSVSDRRDLSAMLEGEVGPVAWHLDGLVRRADDYEIPTGGRQQGTFVDAYSAAGGASWFIGESGRVGASYSRFQSDYGIPEEDEDAKIDMYANRVQFEGDWFAPVTGVREVRVRGAYTDYRHDEIVEGVTGQTYRNDQFDGRFELLHEELYGFHGALGLTGGTRDFRAGGEAGEFMAPAQTTQVAGYLYEEREIIHGLVAEFGARIEGTDVRGTPYLATQERTRSFLPVSGSLGLVVDPSNGVTIGILGAISQRAPAETELFARGPHEATATFEIGDPDLDEETAYTGEIRVAYETDRLRIAAAGFVTYYDGYIFGNLTGGTIEGLDELRFGARSSLFAGTEVELDIDLFDALGGVFGVDAQMDYVHARFTSGVNRNVPRIPPIRWGANLFYRGDWVRARFGFLRTQAQDAVSDDETPTSGFTFLNASFTLDLSPWFARVPVEFIVQGTNLLDQKGRNVVSFTADEVLLPGRNVRGAIRVRF
ncbi:MAG: TonB-dependent receptor [Myxococcota bacterium]|nr:TonB-dependent receptor [Myxococcota bacterium]